VLRNSAQLRCTFWKLQNFWALLRNSVQRGTLMQVCKYATMQLCKYACMQNASMQVFKYVCKYACVCKYANMQVCKYTSMQVCTYIQVCKYASMKVCKYASMHIYASMQVCSYIQRFSENSLPYSNLLYPTYPTNKSEAIYMSAVAAFFS